MIGAAAYIVLMTIWIYRVVDRGADATGWLIPLIALAQVALGLAVRRWWAGLLPVLVVLISVPAQNPPITPETAEPFPIFVSLLVALPIGLLLVALGVLGGKLYNRRTNP